MIDYIVYGEFDINEGNVIKIEYPKKTGVSEMILSSYMIPEGAHNTMNDTFCFIINKKTDSDEIIIPGIKKAINNFNQSKSIKYLNFAYSKIYNEQIDNKGFIVKEIYNLDSSINKWNSLKATTTLSKDQTIYIKVSLDEKEKIYKLVIYTLKSQNNQSDIDEIFNIPIHKDIQFQKLSTTFASVYTLNSQAIGFEFLHESDLALLSSLFSDSKNIKESYPRSEELIGNSHFTNTSEIINIDNDIYFLCSLETKLDKTQKRGAILKSVAVGTMKLINLNSFQSTCRFLLDQSFLIHSMNISPNDKIEKMKKAIEYTYNAFNALKYSFGVSLSRYERSVYSFINSDVTFTLPTTPKKEDIYISTSLSPNNTISIDLSLSANEENIFLGSVFAF